MSIRDIIEAANPCNVCKPGLRSTCESLGRCATRDAWRRVERESSLMEAVCEAVGEDEEAARSAKKRLTAYREEHQ